MNNYDITDILEFLQTPKSRKEIEDKFNLSNSTSFRLLRWLQKANLITVQAIRSRKPNIPPTYVVNDK